MSQLRPLWKTPILTAEWDEEYEERAASWWELFVDLLLVVTCSSVAEAFEEDISFGGFLAFLTTFTLFFWGWNLYTQFCSRFFDESLLHHLQLFLFLLATSSMVTNANGFQYVQQFAVSAILQRCAMLFMYVSTYIQLPRSRSYLITAGVITLVSIAFLTASALSSSQTMSSIFLGLSALWEALLEWPAVIFLMNMKLVTFDPIPLNIEHNQERLGCLIMVVLGESILSALFDYHRRGLDPAATPDYLAAMGLSMCLTFAFALIYYALRPQREGHALRRSGLRGIGFLVGHLCLAASLLAVGVGVKLAIHPLLEQALQPPPSMLRSAAMPPAHAWLLFGATAASMGSVLFLRIMHYGGRGGGGVSRAADSAAERTVKHVWQAGFVGAALLPLLVGVAVIPSSGGGGVHPVQALQLDLAIVAAFALAESLLQHLLYTKFFQNESGRSELDGDEDPSALLLPSRKLAGESMG